MAEVESAREGRAAAAAMLLAAAGAVLLALALRLSSGLLHPTALYLVTAATVATIGASELAGRGAARAPRLVLSVLGIAIAGSVASHAVFLPGFAVEPSRLGAFRPVLGATAVVLSVWLWPAAPRWLVRARFPLLVTLATVLGALVILASPAPAIDAWEYQQRGALGFLSGQNPYTALYPNIYGPGTPYLDPSLLTPDGHYVRAYPYPPLIVLLEAPFAWLGDVRWAMLAAAAACALLVRALGRGAVEAELAGALLLLQPRGFMVLELSWNEPVALAGILAVAWAVQDAVERPQESSRAAEWWLPGLAAALAISTKQYVAILLVPFLLVLPARVRWRALALATGGAALLLLPFLAWDPSAFLRGTVEFQFRQPFRSDALSWPAAVVAWGGPQIPTWPAFAAAGLVLVASLRRPVTPARAMLAAAGTWLVFVLFNKQAFCNYYWMAVGLLCAAVALLAVPSTRHGRGG